jgi:hypothetical protein
MRSHALAVVFTPCLFPEPDMRRRDGDDDLAAIKAVVAASTAYVRCNSAALASLN